MAVMPVPAVSTPRMIQSTVSMRTGYRRLISKRSRGLRGRRGQRYGRTHANERRPTVFFKTEGMSLITAGFAGVFTA